MKHIKLRIGAKLGISSALGLALVAAIVVIGQLSSNSVSQATSQALLQQMLSVDVHATEVGFGKLRAAYRDIKLSHSSPEVDKMLDRLRTGLEQTRTALTAASGKSPTADIRNGM